MSYVTLRKSILAGPQFAHLQNETAAFPALDSQRSLIFLSLSSGQECTRELFWKCFWSPHLEKGNSFLLGWAQMALFIFCFLYLPSKVNLTRPHIDDAVLENPQGSLAYTEMGDAGASITQTSIIHSPGVFEKSDETKKKVNSRNINRDLNSAMRTALAYASKASSHPRAAWLWWGAVEKGLRNKYFTDWKMGDGETNQFPPTLPLPGLKQYCPC